MRHWYQDLEVHWPDTFHIDVDNHMYDSFQSLFVIPMLLYLILWTVPYFFTIFVLKAKEIEERHLETMFTNYKDILFTYIRNVPESMKSVVYMSVHALLCSITFTFSYVCLWDSFILNTLYLLVLFAVAIMNAGTYYKYKIDVGPIKMK